MKNEITMYKENGCYYLHLYYSKIRISREEFIELVEMFELAMYGKMIERKLEEKKNEN